MAEILVMAISHTHLVGVDDDKDRRGCYKRGYVVEVREDGAINNRGRLEGLPTFVWIKVPEVSVEKVEKYTQEELEDTPQPDGSYRTYRRRLWKIRWADLPLAARNRLRDDGELVIKAKASYTGPYDYTWAQVKQFFRNQKTNLDETEDLE